MARKDSPMILRVENGESYIASDVPAILKYTEMYYVGNLEMARIRKEITFYNLDGDRNPEKSRKQLNGMQAAESGI